MDKAINEAAQRYDETSAAGQKFLRENWSYFQQCTRDWLISSKHYDKLGRLQALEAGDSSDEIESLQYDLGVLKRCADATLPERGKRDGLVPGETLSDEVLSAAGTVMRGPRGHEPEFLRLALLAVKQHQLAALLLRLPPERNYSAPPLAIRLKLTFLVLVGIVTFLFLIASPALLGIALTNAAKGDESSAILALYGIGFGLLLLGTMKSLDKNDKEKALVPDEVAYRGWTWLNPYGSGPWLAVGRGATAHLEDMLRKGAKVPLVALDLCAMLTARVTSA